MHISDPWEGKASMAEIVIPTPEHNCEAYRALRIEGLDPVELKLVTDFGYGNLFAGLWDQGEPFVIVEYDIVPWPGAVQALIDCPEPWCTNRYPLHRGNVALSFGIGKYVPTGEAPAEWSRVPWHLLDGSVIPFLNKLFGHSHVHEPPCAHCRREVAA